MSEHNASDAYCDCEHCREMSPLQLRQAWDAALDELAEARAELERYIANEHVLEARLRLHHEVPGPLAHQETCATCGMLHVERDPKETAGHPIWHELDKKDTP